MLINFCAAATYEKCNKINSIRVDGKYYHYPWGIVEICLYSPRQRKNVWFHICSASCYRAAHGDFANHICGYFGAYEKGTLCYYMLSHTSLQLIFECR